MILIGRGLDLEEESEEMSKQSEGKPWSGGTERSDLCGFEGAKPGAGTRSESEAGALEDEVRRPIDGRQTEKESASAKGGSPAPFR